MAFLRYDQLPDVSAAWSRYGDRCRVNSDRLHSDLASIRGCSDPEFPAVLREKMERWEQAHAVSWSQYSDDWQAALAAKQAMG